MDNIYALLEDLDALLNEGRKVPLTNQYVINRETAIGLVQRIRENLPEEIKEANSLLERKEQLKEEANNEYHNTIAEAESKARALTLDTKQRADKLLSDAQAQSQQTLEDAQSKAGDTISNAERKAAELVANTSIMLEAERESTRIIAEARTEAQRDRLAALDICEEMLKHVEDVAIDVANKLRDERMNFDRDR